MIYSFKILQRYQLSKVILVVLLLIVLVVGAVPGYITGKWSWKNTPRITNFKDLRQIREEGLTISDLPTISHQKIRIADHNWLLQKVKQDNQSVILLLLTPNGPKDKPQVEWMDINGFNRWKTDSHQRVKFTVKIAGNGNGTTDSEKQSSNIEARFFRGWTNQQTYAVMQWYAWPGGGSPETGDWFWKDRSAMISKKRVPWVAVNILLPVEPLADIDPYLPQVKSIGEKIQASLMKEAFK
ncbi:MAG: cyanoexosortase B system-associated protein [Okeania sp. SIO2F4]|uniref:cyanoexosortase B system-associated protein n=1 Tax=Okeania sp. SIO2F4 TaxID=2607790 RepID=UPI00142B4E0A|nr:cyanoexosortase B system-associated protein [Okeania sp. SIO2F4]NES07581.1 cyanoexosortase B system-associated protein [Okeania sp. SIO2F4]